MRHPTLCALALSACFALHAGPAHAEADGTTASGAVTQTKSKTKTSGTDEAPTKKTATKKTATKKTATKKTATKKTATQPKPRSTPRKSSKKKEKPVVEALLAKGAIGVHVGGSASWLVCDCTGAGDIEHDATYGLAAGVYYDKAINRFLSYRGALRYHGKGAVYEKDGADFEVALTTAEIEGALLLRYGLNRMTTLYLSVGGFLGAILDTAVTRDGVKDAEEADNYAFLDYGLNIGGGAFFALSRSRGLMASATLLYSHGLANIAADPEALGLEDETDALTTRAVLLTGAIHF